MDEIEPIQSLHLPFKPDDKIFNCVDEDTGEIIGEPYNLNDWCQKIKDISGVNEELLGEKDIPGHEI